MGKSSSSRLFLGNTDVSTDDGETLALTPAAIPPTEFRLFLSPNLAVGAGGNGFIMGTNQADVFRVLDVPGRVTTDSSFNRGGDLIRLTGKVADWTVRYESSSAVFDDGDTVLAVPAGINGLGIAFDDAIFILRYDAAMKQLVVGTQALTDVSAPIVSPPVNAYLGPDTPQFGSSKLFLLAGGEATVRGDVSIVGTNAAEHVTLDGGNVFLDQSFNRGGDTVSVKWDTSLLTARVESSSVVISTALGFSVTIPVGTVGLTVEFTDSVRTLRYDPVSEHFMLGDQVIPLNGPVQLGIGNDPVGFIG